jgi:SLOG cluster2
MSATRLDISLEPYEIGLSGAVPDRRDWSEPAMDRGILEFVALFSALVFKYGGRIVHGSHPTFTPVIIHQARLHAGERTRKPVTLLMSDLWSRELREEERQSSADVAEVIITKAIGSGGVDDVDTRNRSLSAMREVLVNSLNIIVAIGGKKYRADGRIPGVEEELNLAGEQKIPRFIIAGMGGYAEEYARNIELSSLNNDLSADANMFLLGSNDVAACVNLLLDHLSTSEKLPLAADRPIKWNPGIKRIVDHRDGTFDFHVNGLVLAAAT